MATRLDLAYSREVLKVRSRMLALAGLTWDGLGSYRDADFERLMRTLVPRLGAGQQQIANLTDSYIRKMAIAEFGAVDDAAVLDVSTEALRGVSASTVYHRPFASTYSALAAGQSVAGAIAVGRERLMDITASGAQLAKTHSARSVMRRSRYTKYQRTLGGRKSCALCVIASTQRYHTGDLLPIHPGCSCGVKPFTSDFDVQVIDEGLLEETHSIINSKLDLDDGDRAARSLGIGKADSGSGAPLSDYTELIVTREHGELGPLLSWRSDRFTGSADLS